MGTQRGCGHNWASVLPPSSRLELGLTSQLLSQVWVPPATFCGGSSPCSVPSRDQRLQRSAGVSGGQRGSAGKSPPPSAHRGGWPGLGHGVSWAPATPGPVLWAETEAPRAAGTSSASFCGLLPRVCEWLQLLLGVMPPGSLQRPLSTCPFTYSLPEAHVR